MPAKNKLTEEIHHFKQLSAKDDEFNQKLDEFISLLQHSNINSENIKGIKQKIDGVLDQKLSQMETVEEIKKVSLLNIGEMEKLDQLEVLLNTNYINSKEFGGDRLQHTLYRIVAFIVGLLFIALGFAMIVMPAPPYFEMFTIFYFNENDGVTLMDLISLIIIALGTLIAIRILIQKKTK